MDCDDISSPDRLKFQYEYMCNHPKCTFLATEGILIDNNGKRIKKIRIKFKGIALKEYLFNYGNPFVHSSFMYLKKAIVSLGCYNEELSHQEDFDLWLKVVVSEYSIDVLHKNLHSLRFHIDSMTNINSEILYLNIAIPLMHLLKNNGIKLGKNEALLLVKNNFYVKHFVQHIITRKLIKHMISSFKNGHFFKCIAINLRLLTRLPYMKSFTRKVILNKLQKSYYAKI